MNDPASFSKHNTSTIDEARYFLSRYKKDFKLGKNENILEIGCANGIITKEVLYPLVKENLGSLLGTDISQNAIHVAVNLHVAPKLSFRQMNIEEEHVWMQHKEQFDHIYTFYLLHMLKSPEKALHSIFNMLKPKGQYFSSVLLHPHPFTIITAIQRRNKEAPWSTYIENVPVLINNFGPYPSETISKIFIDVGFNVDITEVHSMTTVLKTLEDLKGLFLSINNFFKHIPEELRNAYTEDYFKNVMEQTEEADDGSYYFRKHVFTIIATKP